MASKRTLWNRFGRLIGGLVVACFFLPFFGVSCQGMDVITISGADMAGGCKPGGMLVEAAKQEAQKHPGESADIKIDSVPREPLAIVALALALASFGFAWLSGDLHSQVDKQRPHSHSDIDKDVEAGSRFGLYIVALGLLSVATITGLALREPEPPSTS